MDRDAAVVVVLADVVALKPAAAPTVLVAVPNPVPRPVADWVVPPTQTSHRKTIAQGCFSENMHLPRKFGLLVVSFLRIDQLMPEGQAYLPV